MGTNFSMAYNTTSTVDGSLKSSRILAFHSSARWKAYFDACKASSKLLVIDFTASWCGPCKAIEPAVIEMANKYTDVDFVKLDVDELMDVAQEYGVQAMPTFILIKEGKEVDKVLGAKKEELEKKILKHRSSSPTHTFGRSWVGWHTLQQSYSEFQSPRLEARKLESSKARGREMGTKFSKACNTTSTVDGSSNPSRVIAFHSSAEWKAHFDACKVSSKLLVIDFSASWCGPCKFIEPVFIQMANKYTDVEFVKIDVDELKDVAKEFGVQAMPTFILMKQGKEVDKVVGADKDELQKKILKHRPSAPTSTV
ncbi:thioredoxin-2-like [Telopea speciosissima]|uniref:thioredoxin-2-like n=1 Tax=Telopea speciosissima TaxID=54955 RepID=UPI001CC4A9EC|nr:thioredoxin-2-like [Telopea speciosissima]